MPLIVRIETVGLEEADPIAFFENVLMMKPIDPPEMPPVPDPPPSIVDQSWLAAPLSLS